MSRFAENLKEIKNIIDLTCKRLKRDPQTVHLLAVSKLQPIELIEEAYHLGLRDFGENYVQELIEKRKKLSHLKDIRWHLIGHLQSNKVKMALEVADVFQALDSQKLLREIKKRYADVPRVGTWPVFIEVNIDEEPQKTGVLPKDLLEFYQEVKATPQVELKGLMCIPQAQNGMTRAGFQKLKQLRDQLDPSLELSMGMSEDFDVAIEEGAHWIRVGTRLFGSRNRTDHGSIL